MPPRQYNYPKVAFKTGHFKNSNIYCMEENNNGCQGGNCQGHRGCGCCHGHRRLFRLLAALLVLGAVFCLGYQFGSYGGQFGYGRYGRNENGGYPVPMMRFWRGYTVPGDIPAQPAVGTSTPVQK